LESGICAAASLDRYQLPIVPATTPSLDALRTYSEARESFRRGDMKSTQTLLDRAVGFDPNFASAYRTLGLSYYKLSDYEKAAEFFKKAFDLRQGTTDRERLSIETMYYAYSLNDLEEAVRRSRQFLQIYPDVAESWVTLCDLLTQLGQYTPPAGTVDPSVDMKAGIRDQVDAMDITAYFSYLAQLMKTNPPSADDAPLVAKMAKIGLVPGQDFDASKLGVFDKEAIKAVPKVAQVKIISYLKDAGRNVNGWEVVTKTGLYGTDYLDWALITAIGLGANRPQDAIYPTSEKDAAGKEYDGASNKYVMHFDKRTVPTGERLLIAHDV
jgi:tetratricopeptide (TPR) repeat protein